MPGVAHHEASIEVVVFARIHHERRQITLARLEQVHRQVETAWRDYEQRFGNVDEALSEAVRGLAAETAKQQESIAKFALEIDKGCGQAVQRLQGIANSLGENTAELSETFDDFLAKLPRAVGA